MKYLLDTNICVFIFRRKFPSVLHRLHQTQPGEVGISAVTLAELRYGADKSCDPPKNHAVIDAFLTTVAVLEFHEDAARLVLSSHRSNLHRGLEKIILRAGLGPWDDLLQTLRSCAETDFARKYPQHVVSRWIGHSIAVSEKHYLMSDSSVMDNAASAPPLLRAAESAAVSSGNATQVQETRRNDEETVVMLASSKECEKPLKKGAFRDSKGGTRTRDPRLMKPVL